MDDEPADEILTATYRALCQHGYANLTLRHIAAESDKSKAAIHYHYESKDELFEAFLAYLYEEYTATVRSVSGETHHEHLGSLLELLLTDGDATPERGFRTAMLEVKAQAPYDDSVQRRLRQFDEFLFGHVRDVIEAGVEDGEFDESVDPDRVAEFLATTVEGARTRAVATGRTNDRLCETVDAYLATQLVADRSSDHRPAEVAN